MIGKLKTREFERECKIFTMRGKRIEDAVEFIEKSYALDIQEHLFLHFSTNNLQDKAKNQEDLISQIITKYKALINAAKLKFRDCHIHISALLNRYDMGDTTNHIIEIINSALQDLTTEDERLSFITHSEINRQPWLIQRRDGVHLTRKGAQLLHRDFELAMSAPYERICTTAPEITLARAPQA